MKIKLLVCGILALITHVITHVSAMSCENDSCQIREDSVQVKNDSVLYDPAQGHIFDRNIDGWVVNSCPSIVIYSCVDSCGNFESIMKLIRAKKYSSLKSPWEKAPRGVNGYFKLNGNSVNEQQSSQPDNSIPWWIQP